MGTGRGWPVLQPPVCINPVFFELSTNNALNVVVGGLVRVTPGVGGWPAKPRGTA